MDDLLDGVDTGGVVVGLAVFAVLFGNAAATFDSLLTVVVAAVVAGLVGYGGYVLVVRQAD